MSQSRARRQRREEAAAVADRNHGARRRSTIAIVGAALLVAVTIAVGVVVARGTGPAQAITGSPSDAIAVAGRDPVTGRTVDLAHYAGTPVVLNVWGSWCHGCNDEAADLKTFADRHPEVQMIGIDLQDTEQGARDFYRRWGWTHPSIYDPQGEIAFALGLQGTPTTYFLDSEHRVVAQIVGATDLAGFEQGLETALSGA